MKNIVTFSSGRLRRLSMACAAVAVQLVWSGSGLGATYTFNGASAIGVTGYIPSWSWPFNWDGNLVPPSSDSSDIVFGGTFGGPLIAIQDIASPLKLHSISFPMPYIIDGQALRWDVAGSIQNDAGGTIVNPLVLNQTVTYSGAASGQLSGAISGAGTLLKSGSGTMILAGATSSFGGLSVAAGNVVMDGGNLTLTSTPQPLFVGSNATMTVSNGAILDTRPGEARLIGDGGFEPTLRIAGAGTTWRAGKIMDGFYGNFASHLIVEAGANISEASLLSIGTADTPVSTMLVQSGGSVTVTDALVGGANFKSHGAATISGAGSTWTINGSLDLGGNTSNPSGGNGIITVSDGGAVVNKGNTKFWNGGCFITVNNATFTTASLASATGAINLASSGASLVINGAAGSSSFTGSLFGSGSVTKSGGSTHYLSGSNSYTGITTVNGGTLRMNASAGRIRVNSGGTFAPSTSAGTVTTSDVTWNSNGTYLLEVNDAAGVAGTNWSLWNINGSLSIPANKFAISMASLTAGGASGNAANFNSNQNYSWRIATATSGITGFDGSKFTLDASHFTNAVNGGTFSLAQSGNNLLLNFTTAFSSAEWIFDGPDGTWSTPANWSTGVVPNGPQASANFLGAISQDRVLHLNGDKTVHDVHFNSPANHYFIRREIGGAINGTLTIGDGNTGLIELAGGGHNINVPIVINGDTTITGPGNLSIRPLTIVPGKTLTKTGSGALLVDGDGSQFHGALAIREGLVAMSYYIDSTDLAISIGGGSATLRLDPGQSEPTSDHAFRNLAIAFSDPGTQTVDVSSWSPPGVFASISVYAADLAASKAALWGAIVNANRAGAVDPLDGIIDSGQINHPNSRLGIARVGDHVLIRSTRIGDVNLDGAVGIADFIDLASHFGGAGTWQEGDLNYDGQVTIADFIDLASNFNSSYTGEVLPVSAEDQQTLGGFAAAHGVGVPEPAVLALVMSGGLLVQQRRRRGCRSTL